VAQRQEPRSPPRTTGSSCRSSSRCCYIRTNVAFAATEDEVLECSMKHFALSGNLACKANDSAHLRHVSARLWDLFGSLLAPLGRHEFACMHACMRCVNYYIGSLILNSLVLCLGSIWEMAPSLGFPFLLYDKRIAITAHVSRCVLPRHKTDLSPIGHLSLAIPAQVSAVTQMLAFSET
jgi:hypothetical protein